MELWKTIQRYFIEGALVIAAHWQIAAAVGVLLLIILIAGGIQSCRSSRNEKKIEQTKETIIEEKINSNIAANAVNAASDVSNQALVNVNAVKNTDSNKQSNSFNDAMNGFCEQFPKDSLCK